MLVQDKITMQVYGMGRNRYGELGTGALDNPHLSKVYYVDHRGDGSKRPLDFPCQKIETTSFSVLLDQRGALFTAGGGSPYFTIVHELFDRNIRVVDVCCSSGNFIALDTSGGLHVGCYTESRQRRLMQLVLSAGPVAQVGAGYGSLFVRTRTRHEHQILQFRDNALGEIFEREYDRTCLTDPEPWSCWKLGSGRGDDEPWNDQREIVQLTGCRRSILIHRARVDRINHHQLPSRLHRLRLNRAMCDTMILTSVDNGDDD